MEIASEVLAPVTPFLWQPGLRSGRLRLAFAMLADSILASKQCQ